MKLAAKGHFNQHFGCLSLAAFAHTIFDVFMATALGKNAPKSGDRHKEL